MPMMQFSGDLAAAILDGRKSQTLRREQPPGCRVGSRLTMMNGYRPNAVFGHAIITAIDFIAVAALTRRDAILDGFATLAELRERLHKIRAPPTLWRIRWRDFLPVPTFVSARLH